MSQTQSNKTSGVEILFEDDEKIEIACSYPDVDSAISALNEKK